MFGYALSQMQLFREGSRKAKELQAIAERGYLQAVKEVKMTREEAFKKCDKLGYSSVVIPILEALGLLKFEPKKDVNLVITTGPGHYKDFGMIRIEEWPEGLVLWVGGEIVWRSWKA